MDKSLIYEKLFYEDLDSILTNSLSDSKESKRKFITELKEYISRLKQFSNLGSEHLVSIRKLVFKNKYNIYYIVNEKEINIIKIINSKLDL